jgi:OFA family oxalate/formate antiporter-like MFS transporter
MQLALGGIYAWSTFAVPLKTAHGLTSAQAQGIFGLTVGTMGCAEILSGRLQRRWGPRTVALLGAAFFAGGYLLAGHSGGSFPLLLAGIGLLGGLGAGLAYLCPITSCVRWWPERKGFISGIALMGYGGGAIVLATVARVAFNHGWDVLRCFSWMGPVWGGVVALSALFLSLPPLAEGEQAPPWPRFRDLARQREYWGLVVGMYCLSFAGLTVIGSLEPMGRAAGLAPTLATLAISLLAVGNMLGRVSWGWVHDRIGRPTVPLALAGAALGALAMLAGGHARPGYLGAAVLTGVMYSGCTVLFAAEGATLWGPHLVGMIYPFLTIYNGLAALTGPAITGALFDRTGSYAAGLILSACVAGGGALVVARWHWPPLDAERLDAVRPAGDNSSAAPPGPRAEVVSQ